MARERTEWNGLPGYLAAERMPGEYRARWNSLGLFDADVLEEFLSEPILAIERKMFYRGKQAKKGDEFDPGRRSFESDNDERDLLTLVMRFATVCVMAERERVREEEEHEQRRRAA